MTRAPAAAAAAATGGSERVPAPRFRQDAQARLVRVEEAHEQVARQVRGAQRPLGVGEAVLGGGILVRRTGGQGRERGGGGGLD